MLWMQEHRKIADLLVWIMKGSIGKHVRQSICIPTTFLTKINFLWKDAIFTSIAAQISLIEVDVDYPKGIIAIPQDILEFAFYNFRTAGFCRPASRTGWFILFEIPFVNGIEGFVITFGFKDEQIRYPQVFGFLTRYIFSSMHFSAQDTLLPVSILTIIPPQFK